MKLKWHEDENGNLILCEDTDSDKRVLARIINAGYGWIIEYPTHIGPHYFSSPEVAKREAEMEYVAREPRPFENPKVRP